MVSVLSKPPVLSLRAFPWSLPMALHLLPARPSRKQGLHERSFIQLLVQLQLTVWCHVCAELHCCGSRRRFADRWIHAACLGRGNGQGTQHRLRQAMMAPYSLRALAAQPALAVLDAALPH